MAKVASESMGDRSGEPACLQDACPASAAVGCLVWSTDDDPLPPSVRQSLERRRVRIVQADSPLAVMTQLALSPMNLLMLVNPDRLADRLPIIRTIEKYYPQIVFWQCLCSNGQPDSLTRFTKDSAAFAQTESSLSSLPSDSPAEDFAFRDAKTPPKRPVRRIPYPGSQARPATRKSRPKPPSPPTHLQLDAGPLLTSEELQMLLNDDSAMRADRSPLSDDGR